MLSLRPDHLERSIEEGARIVALGFLAEAAAALERLERGGDPEALHDFRVALRRLRSTLRAYRPHLKGASARKLGRELRAIAGATNAARDAEVQLAWLRSREGRLTPEERAGWEHLVASVEQRVGSDEDRFGASIRDFRAIQKRLARKLGVYEARVEWKGAREAWFLPAAGKVVSEQSASFREALAAISSAADDDAVHRARIRAKRLRYLIEPFRGRLPAAKELVKRLKSVQDLLGELHDTRLLTDEVSAALERTAAAEAQRYHASALEPSAPVPFADPPERPGLIALLRILKEERQSLSARFQKEWTGGAEESFFSELDRLAGGMMAREPERRRYLLASRPESIRGDRGTVIEEGWLPGKKIRERVLRIRSARSVSCRRVVELPDGGEPLEEKISASQFARLWPLTERRLRKRRHELREGELTWHIDELTDHDILLAEVRGPCSRIGDSPPDWLLPHLAREVTGDRRYQDFALAARERQEAETR